MGLLETLFGFRGRIGRTAFWLCAIAIVFLDAALAVAASGLLAPRAAGLARASAGVTAFGLAMLALAGLSAWAWLALATKRLHDRGRSGLWLLALAVPVVGPLWLLWEMGAAPGPAAAPSGA